MKYYVSTYELYPIYEPAEGGYYYDGLDFKYSIECNSLKKARRVLRKMIAELKDYGEDVYDFGFAGHLWGARTESKYIGEGTVIHIETRNRKNERGYVPYC